MSTVLIVVGTTRFDRLVQTVLTPEVQEALSRKGYNHMVIQYGRSEVSWNDLEAGK